MSYRDTHDTLCILLEEYADADIETVAEQILGALGVLGQDLVDTLDPPVGLTTWLASHGLSIVATVETRSPRVWEAVEAEEDEETDNDPEEAQEGGMQTLPQVGEYVEYRTAPKGPSRVQEMGSGWVVEMGLEEGVEFLWVDNGGKRVYVVPAEGDRVSVIPR